MATRGRPFAVTPVNEREVVKQVETLQRNVRDTFDQLEDVRRGMVVSTVEVVPGALELAEQLVVAYTGKGGHTMLLPPASGRGSGRGQLLLVANQGTGTVTVKPAGTDTLNGLTSVAVNVTAAFFSDGNTKWHEISVPANVVLSTRNLISTADITLDGSAGATKDLAADRTIGLANAGAGAGTTGAGSTIIASITLDAKGRVTGLTTLAVVPATRLVSAGAGLSGGGDLSADRTISMPNVGPGAGTIGAANDIPTSITLDAQGRVTAVTTENGLITLSAGLTVTTDVTARDFIGRRLQMNSGTNLVAGDFVLSAGWGATRSISNILNGSKDTRGEFTVSSAGAGQAANPTITLTFKDGAFGGNPMALVKRNGGTGANTEPTWVTLGTTLTITWPATPVAGQTYTFSFHVIA